MDNGTCKYIAVPIKVVGVYNILFVAHVGWVVSCLLLLLLSLFPLLFSLPACLLVSFLPVSVFLYTPLRGEQSSEIYLLHLWVRSS